jgi:preprotein translocase subunit Sss1
MYKEYRSVLKRKQKFNWLELIAVVLVSIAFVAIIYIGVISCNPIIR